MALDFVTNYYGVDWLAMVLAFIAVYLLGNKKRSGFLVGMFACVFWCIFAYMAESLADILANGIVLLLYYKGYKYWKKDDDASTNNLE